jgi:hypothetical protein
VVVGEGGTDGFAHFEAAVIGLEDDLGRRERVVGWEFEYAVVEALRVLFLEVVEAEVKGEVAVPLQNY